MLRRTRLRPQSPSTRSNGYQAVRAKYLEDHPWCQITIARLGLSETDVKAHGQRAVHGILYRGHWIPAATEIHHRNKSNGPRKCDTRWFMAASRTAHDYVEDNKTWARAEGYLLPINATPDGFAGGQRYQTTEQLMGSKVNV